MNSSFFVSYDFGTDFLIEWSSGESTSYFIPWKNVGGTRTPLTLADKIPAEDVESKSGKFSISANGAPPESYYFRTRGGLLLCFVSSHEVMPAKAYPLANTAVVLPPNGDMTFGESVPRGTNRSKDKYEMKLVNDKLYSVVLSFPNESTRASWDEYLIRYVSSISRSTASTKALFEFAALSSELEGGIYVLKKHGQPKNSMTEKDSFPPFGGSKKWLYLLWSGPPEQWSLVLSRSQLPSKCFEASYKENLEDFGDSRNILLSDVVRVSNRGEAFHVCIQTANLLFETYLLTPIPTSASKSSMWSDGINATLKLRKELLFQPENDSVGKHSDFRQNFLFTERNVARRGTKKRSSKAVQVLRVAETPNSEGNVLENSQRENEKSPQPDLGAKDGKNGPSEKKTNRFNFVSSLLKKKPVDSEMQEVKKHIPSDHHNPNFLPSFDSNEPEDGTEAQIPLRGSLPLPFLNTRKRKSKESVETSTSLDNRYHDKLMGAGELGSKSSSSHTVRGPAVEAAHAEIDGVVDPLKLFVPPSLNPAIVAATLEDGDSQNEDSPSRRISQSHYNWKNVPGLDLSPEILTADNNSALVNNEIEPGSNYQNDSVQIPAIPLGSRKAVSAVAQESDPGSQSTKDWGNNPSRLSSFFGVYSKPYSSSGLSSSTINDSDTEQEDIKDDNPVPLCRSKSSGNANKLSPAGLNNMQKITEEENSDLDEEKSTTSASDNKRIFSAVPVVNVAEKEVPVAKKNSNTSKFRLLMRTVFGRKQRDEYKSSEVHQESNTRSVNYENMQTHDTSTDKQEASTNVSLSEERKNANAPSLLPIVSSSSIPFPTRRSVRDQQADDSSSENSERVEGEGLEGADVLFGPISPHAAAHELPKESGFFKSIFKNVGGSKNIQKFNGHTSSSSSNVAKSITTVITKNSNFRKKRSSSLRNLDVVPVPGGDGGILESRKDIFSSPSTRRATLSSQSLSSFSSPHEFSKHFSDVNADDHIEEWEHAVIAKNKKDSDGDKNEKILNESCTNLNHNNQSSEKTVSKDYKKSPSRGNVGAYLGESVKYGYGDDGMNGIRNRSATSDQNTENDDAGDSALCADMKDLLNETYADDGNARSAQDIEIFKDSPTHMAIENSRHSDNNLDDKQSGNFHVSPGDSSERNGYSSDSTTSSTTLASKQSGDFSTGLTSRTGSSSKRRIQKSKIRKAGVNSMIKKGNLENVSNSNRSKILAGLVSDSLNNKIFLQRMLSVNERNKLFCEQLHQTADGSYSSSSEADGNEFTWFSGNIESFSNRDSCVPAARSEKGKSTFGINIKLGALDSTPYGSFLSDIDREYKVKILHKRKVILQRESSLNMTNTVTEDNPALPHGTIENSVSSTLERDFSDLGHQRRTPEKKVELFNSDRNYSQALPFEENLPKAMNMTYYSSSNSASTRSHLPVRKARHYTANSTIRRRVESPSKDLNPKFKENGSSSDIVSPSKALGFIAGVGKMLFSQGKSKEEQKNDSPRDEAKAVALQQKEEIMDLLNLAKRNAAMQTRYREQNIQRPLHGVTIGRGPPVSVPNLSKSGEGDASEVVHEKYSTVRHDEKNEIPKLQLYDQPTNSPPADSPTTQKKKLSPAFKWWSQPSSDSALENFAEVEISRTPGKRRHSSILGNSADWKLPMDISNANSCEQTATNEPNTEKTGDSKMRRHSFGEPISPNSKSIENYLGSASLAALPVNRIQTPPHESASEKHELTAASTIAMENQMPNNAVAPPPRVRKVLSTANAAVRRESIQREQRSIEEENRLADMRKKLKEKLFLEKKQQHENLSKINASLENKNSIAKGEEVEYILKAQYKGAPVSLFLGNVEILIRHNETGKFSALPFSDIISQEMDGNGSGLFRIKRKIHGQSLGNDGGEFLTFLSIQPYEGPDPALNTAVAKHQYHKSSIYVLSQVHQSSGVISVQRTNLTLKEWLTELERRRRLLL